MRERLPLSELPQFLNRTYTLNVPVYTVWGACEDVQVLEKLRSGEYRIDNLHIIDEAHSRLIDAGGVKLRLLGVGGAVVMHKLFDNGEGRTTIAGGQGTMWNTLLQMGELIDTANRVFDPTETRVFITHASPAREGLLNQLSVTLKADFSVSAGLHFRYGSSYNEFSVNPTLDHYRGKLAASKTSFHDVWETVKSEVLPAVQDSESQTRLLNLALELVEKMPASANSGTPFGGSMAGAQNGQIDESAFKNMWNFNLADAAYGWLVLDIDNGRIGTEMRAQGFNFSHRGTKSVPQQSAASVQTTAGAAAATHPAKTASPAPARPQANATPPVQPTKTAQPARAGPSPLPVTPKESAKPATPQPASASATANAASEKEIPSEGKPNGAAPGKGPASPASKEMTKKEPVERRDVYALFVQNCSDEAACKNLLAAEDRDKIDRIERQRHNFVIHFASHQDMTTALSRTAPEVRGAKTGDPSIKIYRDPASRGGTWQGGARSGGPAGGYRSDGRASDSESGRGRGGFRGTRSERGNRERGGRGRTPRNFGRSGGGPGGDGNQSPAVTGAEAQM